MVARPLIAGSLALVGVAGCGGVDGGEAPSASTGPTVGTPTASTAPNRSPAAPTTPTPPPPPRGTVIRGPVVYVSDGDTAGVRLAGVVERVRLLGIDAPETKDPSAPIACFGPQSAAALRSLIQRGVMVTVVSDPTQDRRDKFGRLLAYVFRANEREPVNQILLRRGAARVYVYRRNAPFKRLAQFRRAEAAAKAAGRGLWGSCPDSAA